VIDEEPERIEAWCPTPISAVAGDRPARAATVRARLATERLGIDILTSQKRSNGARADFENSTRSVMEALQFDEVVRQLVAFEGFTSGGGTGAVDVKELASIQRLAEKRPTS